MPTVLIVDDNDDIRTLIKRGLELEGYDVLQAGNGKIAQDLMKSSTPPGLVLLDLMMPVMDGREFLEWKNGRAEFSSVKVVVFSAAPGANDQLTGVAATLRKPVDLGMLLEIAERCFANY